MIGTPEIVILIALGFLVWRFIKSRDTRGREMYCPTCGTVGPQRKHTKGSMWIELVLWLFFLLPGLIYSIWRLSTQQLVCGACGTPGTIPVTSPRAMAALTADAKPK